MPTALLAIGAFVIGALSTLACSGELQGGTPATSRSADARIPTIGRDGSPVAAPPEAGLNEAASDAGTDRQVSDGEPSAPPPRDAALPPPQRRDAAPRPSTVVLGVQGSKLTLDGKPTFLLGTSYFDGMHWRDSDLAQLAQKGFQLIRVWLYWDVNFDAPGDYFFDRDGNLVAEQKLVDLVRTAASYGLVVDLTVLEVESFAGSQAKRLRAVSQVGQALTNEKNVLFDLMNEHDVSGTPARFPTSHAEVKELLQALRAAKHDAIATVSGGGAHHVKDLTLQSTNVQAEIDLGVDLITPHFTRTADWYDKTDRRVTLVSDYLAAHGASRPIYLQEEQRIGWNGSDPSAADFITAYTKAKDAGAAAWVFHTSAAYDLVTASYFASLNAVEKQVIDALSGSP